MTFIRLAGCSVRGCSIRLECDESPWATRERLSAAEIASRVTRAMVCITGGEPTDHDLGPLVSELRQRGKRVHIETSGSRHLAGVPFDWITVSPKTNDYVQRQGHTLKVVLRPEWTWTDVERLDTGTQFFHRYIQPLSGADNLAQVIAMLTSDRNVDGRWALSVQGHKLWDLP